VASSGDLAAAEAESFVAYELGLRVGQPDAILFYGGQLYALRLEEARLRTIAHLFRPFADVEGAPPMILAMQALIDCALDEEDDARRHLAAIIAVGLDKIPEDDLRMSTFAHVTEVARRRGDLDTAAELDRLFAPATGALIVTVAGAVGMSGAVSHYRGVLRGVLGDGDGAVELLEEALARHETVGAPAWLNRTRVELAAALAGRDPARAQQLAARAAEESGRIGLVAINDAATQLLSGSDGT
jgi:hypothetical protein